MQTFVLWRHIGEHGPRLAPERVASDLQKLFAPLFATPPATRILQNEAMSLVVLELPVQGWRPPFFQEDDQTWARAVDFPIDARAVLAERGAVLEQGSFLPALGRELQQDPMALLRRLAPPFSLIWSSKRTGETFAQNDGLGQAQLFEFQGERLWALTNRIVALKALGVRLEPVPEEWAVRSTLGWFPLDLTGYKRIRFLGPGTQLRLGPHGLSRTTHDVLSGWLHPDGLSPDDCLELARCSLLAQLRAAMPLWEQPSAGLSGGWDSRAVVSSLRVLGADFSVRVGGLPGHPDVLVASELAKIAGLDLAVRHTADLPPDHADACRSSIERALLWQAGYIDTRLHKSFLAPGQHLIGGMVNVMGHRGEIGRGYYAKQIRASEVSEDRYEERLVSTRLRRRPPFIRQAFHDPIRETIEAAYRQADRYGLTGLARLDFFCVYEGTRRWASGSLSSQPNVVVAPFLNPDYIRATFGYPGSKETNPFHRHIVATNSPDWADVPHEEDLLQASGREEIGAVPEPGSESLDPLSWKRPTGGAFYDAALYWQMVGKPLIDEGLARDGFWTEVFEPDATKAQWLAAPDHLALVLLLPHVL